MAVSTFNVYRKKILRTLTPSEEEILWFQKAAVQYGITDKNQNMNTFDTYYRNALFYSCTNGNYPITKALLEKGTLSNWIDLLGDTPLHVTIQSIQDPALCSRIVYLLLVHGANPNLHVEGHLTPMMMAVLKENIEVVDMLLLYGADLNRRFLTDSVLLIPNNSSALSLATSFVPNADIIRRLVATKKLTPEVVFHASCKAIPSMKQVLMKSL